MVLRMGRVQLIDGQGDDDSKQFKTKQWNQVLAERGYRTGSVRHDHIYYGATNHADL